MNHFDDAILDLTRRELFQSAGMGIGAAALSSLLTAEDSHAVETASRMDLSPQIGQFAPRAKNVIFLHMIGAPSHLDLFVDKPKLREMDGEKCPEELFEGQRFAFLRGHPTMYGSTFDFQKHGESGHTFSDVLPNLASIADELAFIETMHTDQFNHGPAQLVFQTGFQRFGRPCMGSWASYGLGSLNQNLPAFVVLITGSVGGAGNSMWGSGFLPTIYQGVEFRSSGDPVLFLSNPKGVSADDRRRVIDAINSLNLEQLKDVGDNEIKTRIGQYEMAYRMQSSVPELMDISQEPDHIHALYGSDPDKNGFANNCLLARRLVERGVRFVQLFDQGWDHHGGLVNGLRNKAKQVDQPVAGLIKDLKQRGLLDETLVIWGAEFGRTPMVQGDRNSAGRDHHKDAFCVWMAGGGIKGGVRYGQTDEFGYHPVENAVTVPDFHATVLHLLGIDHKQLTYRYQGRDVRLTDVSGSVVTELIA